MVTWRLLSELKDVFSLSLCLYLVAVECAIINMLLQQKKVKLYILPYNLPLNISVLNPQADSWGPELITVHQEMQASGKVFLMWS